jgi:hypothetical protein
MSARRPLSATELWLFVFLYDGKKGGNRPRSLIPRGFQGLVNSKKVACFQTPLFCSFCSPHSIKIRCRKLSLFLYP